MKINFQIDESNRHEDGLAAVMVKNPVSELQYSLDLPFAEIYAKCSIPDDLALDLVLVASLCYVVDKMVPRSNPDIAPDFWTRELEPEFPVRNPEKWSKIAADLNQTLSFLTGDLWRVSFRKRKEDFFIEPPPKKRRGGRVPPVRLDGVDAVCSFSGGVDSLAGAINLLEDKNFTRIHLIGHYDASGARKPQHDLFERILPHYSGKAELTHVRVSHKPLKALESTLRSRSFVFIALGLYASRSAGENVPLYMPENGFIAMNVPLTPSRFSSCSTRTMHPFFLARLRGVLAKLGIKNEIINPFELKTKGECVSECANRNLLKTVINDSVSCSHGSRKQYWVRRSREIKNCGYCVPCLIRRASLNKADMDNSLLYGLDVCAGELNYDDDRTSADDLRAVIHALRREKSAADFEEDIIAVAPVDNLEERARMIERGFKEIKTLFLEKGTKEVLRATGLTVGKK